MYRYGAPGRGRYREHWQASVEAIGSDDPAIDAELIQLYDTLLGRLGVTELRAPAELDRLPRVPPRLSRGAPCLARRRTSTGSTRRRARRRRRARSACSTTTRRSRRRSARRSTRRRRSASRSATACARAFRARCARDLDASGVVVHARADARARARLLLPHDLGVHRPDGERELDDLRRRPLRLPGRGDRRPADAGRRLRRRARAAPDRDGGGRRRRPSRAGRRLLRARGGRAARARCRAG